MKTTKKFDELKRATLVNTDTWEDTYYRFKLWEKGGHKRVYVNYGNKQKSKRDVGYIDARTGEFYGDENSEVMKMVERFKNEYMEEE